VCINDVYGLENFPRLKNLVQHHLEAKPADKLITTLAGDFIGPSMLSSLDRGKGMIDCLNAIPVSNVGFGNHEDDVDIEQLRLRIAEFQGVWLNTNMPDFAPALPKDQVLTVSGPGTRSVRVGLLAVVMAEPTIYRRKPFGGATIEPANETAQREAKRLMQEERCACVIPMTHQEMADDRLLAHSQRSPLFPVIVGGHEHVVFIEEVEGTWVVKAGSDAQHAVIVDLSWPAEAPTDGSPDLPQVTVRLDDVAAYPEDAALRARVNGHMRAVHELEAATLMRLGPGQALSSVGTRVRQTSMGSLLCSLIRDVLDADICFFNGGGIRASHEYPAHFTYGDLKAEVPFDNEMVVVRLPGRVIREAIAASRAHAPIESGGFLQVDDQTVVNAGNSVESIGGEPLVEDRIYRVATVRPLMTGMDHEEPLVRYSREHSDCLPPVGSGRDAKMILVEAFSLSLWRQLGAFEAIDLDGDGRITPSEVASAISRTTAEEASQITVDLLLKTIDANHDSSISREEAESASRRLNSSHQKPKP
jgi:2',3'-cyclic-nucleotide 2'-phosphodiesterase (5'-nucleotidase family)